MNENKWLEQNPRVRYPREREKTFPTFLFPRFEKKRRGRLRLGKPASQSVNFSAGGAAADGL